jgi:hypothetical protein
MELKYTYEQDGKFLTGFLDDYPQYPTQGENIQDLEEALKEIYDWIMDGTLPVEAHKGVLQVAR